MHSFFFSLTIRRHTGSGIRLLMPTATRPLLALILLVVGATQINHALANDEMLGRELFLEADKRNSGYVDFEVKLRMTLRTSRGATTTRDLRIRQLEVPADGDMIMVIFDTPASIRGTSLLSHSHKDSTDDQWLLLPALKRVKKIASRNKSGPFVGSEFSFEDLSAQEVDKYIYRYLEQQQFGGQACHVIERRPLDEYSGYTKEIYWLDETELRVQKVEYFDRRDRPVKVLTIFDYQLYQEKFWKPGRMHMQNLNTQKSTDLEWQDYRFAQGFTAQRDFSVASLRRAR